MKSSKISLKNNLTLIREPFQRTITLVIMKRRPKLQLKQHPRLKQVIAKVLEASLILFLVRPLKLTRIELQTVSRQPRIVILIAKRMLIHLDHQ